jgi:hypothetical protein
MGGGDARKTRSFCIKKELKVIYQQHFVYFCIIGVYTLSAEKD